MEKLSIKRRLLAFSNIPKFLKLVFNTSPFLTISNLIIRITIALLPVAMLYVGKLIIDEIILITGNSGQNVSQIKLWELVAVEGGLMVLINALNKVTNYLDGLLGDLFANKSAMKIMSHAATLDLEQFEDSAFYDKLERARHQTTNRTILLTQILSQIQDFITLGSLGVSLVVFNPWFIFILVFSTIPSFLGENYFNSKYYVLNRSQMNRRRELEYLSFIGASDQTAKETRVFNLSPFLIGRFSSIARRLYRDNKSLGSKRVVWSIILSVVATAGYYTAFIYIIKKVLDGQLTIGDLTFLLGSIRALGSVLSSIIRNVSQVSQGALFLTDYFEFFNIKPKIVAAAKPRRFPNPIMQGFVFENVGYRYFNSTTWANRHLNFTLNAGEKLALVGENGAGKTTLVKLLARLYDPTEGRILLDGYDLKEYDIKELRANIGVIFQDFLRYQMTAAENISIGNINELKNRELIINSAKQSLANIAIERLPKRYEQMLGRHFENGVELSGGEWQKVALARAYMREAQLMILDEPTAALDARAEYEVFERFADLTKNKTAILISHRFSTVRMADRILLLERGELKEIGSHSELLMTDGKYAELFNLQAMGYQ
jgi:ATP-binding cassette, subfamily B, bacterial